MNRSQGDVEDDTLDTVNPVDGMSIGTGAFVGDSSTLMTKLNNIVNAQDDNEELNHLWKLCLMSLMVDDQGKLNKIKTVANMYMFKQGLDSIGAIGDGDTTETEICDFYLDQMIISKQNAQKRQMSKKLKGTDPPLPPAEDNSNSIDTTVVTEQQQSIDKEDIPVGNNKMGGLIGQALMDKDDEDDTNDVEENDASTADDEDINVEQQQFKGDKVVFQSGNSEKISDIQVNIVADDEEEEQEPEETEEEQGDEQLSGDIDMDTDEEQQEEQGEEEEEQQESVPDVPEERPAHSDM